MHRLSLVAYVTEILVGSLNLLHMRPVVGLIQYLVTDKIKQPIGSSSRYINHFIG